MTDKDTEFSTKLLSIWYNIEKLVLQLIEMSLIQKINVHMKKTTYK